MKKFILTFIALSVLGLSAWGQHTPGWFVGMGAGMNIGIDGYQFVDRANSHAGAGFSGSLYLGKWFNDDFGFRVGYQGFGISDCYTDFGKYPYHFAHADIFFRIRRLFVPYLHAGYVSILNPGVAGGIGLVIPVKLGKRVTFVPDFRASFFDSKVFNLPSGNIATSLTASVGLAIRLGKIRPRPKQPDYQDYLDYLNHPVSPTEPRVIRDTVVVPEVIVKEVHDTVYVYQATGIEENKTASAAMKIRVLFDTGKYDLRPESLPELDKIAERLLAQPDQIGVIEGHTDNTASATLNLRLSKDRAKAVFDYLVRKGVSPNQLTWEGYGFDRPAADNTTPEGRQQNRRVEINVE